MMAIAWSIQGCLHLAFHATHLDLELSGGSGVFKGQPLEQIFRDVRMGRFHPTNDLVTHELVGKMCLGVDPDDPTTRSSERRSAALVDRLAAVATLRSERARATRATRARAGALP